MIRASLCLLAALTFGGFMGCGTNTFPSASGGAGVAVNPPLCSGIPGVIVVAVGSTCGASPPPLAEASPASSAASLTYALRAEWQGPCQKASAAIDVNLGNAPQAFVQAAYCQINGVMPDASVMNVWVPQLMQPDTTSFTWHARRSDVVRDMCAKAGVACTLAYSNPWTNEPVPQAVPCAKKNKGDLGTVMLFSFRCPGGTNCTMDWTNTHAFGMTQSDPSYNGYYNPFTNSGFWSGELRDAESAGLQFVALNLYGDDLNAIDNLATVLPQEDGAVKIALFNDTWGYGNILPSVDLRTTAQAAQAIYATQWKPFFTKIATKYQYAVDGRPLIYFYNAGTLKPTANAAAVLSAMKQMFLTDFGVTPFLMVDEGFFSDPKMSSVADGEFSWSTIGYTSSGVKSNVAKDGRTFTNGMIKWDSFNRDVGEIEAVAANDPQMIKGPFMLQTVLRNGAGADVLLLESWNDFGDGSQYNRNYDYYYQGQWLPPDYFLKIVRQATCAN